MYTDEVIFNKGTNFIKLYSDVIEELESRLTTVEFATTIKIVKFICYFDCIIRTSGRRNGNVLSVKQLAKKMNIPYDTFRKTMASLVKKEVFKRCIVPSTDKSTVSFTAIICNPWIFSKGDKISMSILDLFANSSWRYICDDAESTDRNSYEYLKWKENVLKRDSYKCQCCGNSDELEVHHKENYADNEDLRVSVDNGISLCRNCHNSKVSGSFHNTYGTRHNTTKQLEEYISKNKSTKNNNREE